MTSIFLTLLISSTFAWTPDEALVRQLSLSNGVNLDLTRQIVEATHDEFLEDRLLSSGSGAVWSWDCATGPDYWTEIGYGDCSGLEQSPINIIDSNAWKTTKSKSNPVGSFVKTVSSAYSVTQSHDAPVYSCVNPGTCGSITWKKKTYYHVQTHFHGMSSFEINIIHKLLTF